MGYLIIFILAITGSLVNTQTTGDVACGDNCTSVASGQSVCSMSYLSALEPLENPVEDDECTLQRFELEDGTVGPVYTPGIGVLSKQHLFSTNIREHRNEAGLLFHLFLNCKTFQDFKNAAMYYKSLVNPMLYSYVFSAAIINRRDTDTFPVPSLDQITPSHFYGQSVIERGKRKIKRHHRKIMRKYVKRRKDFRKSRGHNNKQNSRHKEKNKHHKLQENIEVKEHEKRARESRRRRHRFKRQTEVDVLQNKASQSSIIQMPLDRTGDDRNPEHKLSYFREDIGINSHHWHWHLVYPLFWINQPGKVLKDRKGELFYYMHNQIVKRYNLARIAAGLKFVEPIPLALSGTIIAEGYYPKLFSTLIGSDFSGRPANLMLQNVTDHPLAGTSTLDDLMNWYNNVVQAINDGQVTLSNGDTLPLDEQLGIDILGSTIEASAMSPNPDFYGDIHNTGHVLLSFIHDPTGVFNASQAVMGFTETALRDPVFWRWHKMVDNLFNLHKAKLPPYNDTILGFPDINIISASVMSAINGPRIYRKNELGTFFKTRLVDISRGLDFESENSTAKVNLTHLDHVAFTYTIIVNNSEEIDLDGHVRIFIAPKYNDAGNLSTDEELRQNSIEMDRFTQILKKGINTITRFSQDSAVTMTPNRQWSQLASADIEFNPSDDNDNFCGCGWPDHLLIPKGTTDGIKYVLFIMISEWDFEKVAETVTYRTCDDSLTMCGLFDKLFPDKRAMGFPLDRPIPNVNNWFNRPNMIRQDITIYHYG